MSDVSAWAPGRVNLIGDHTDYTGGLVLPMAIDLGTTVSGRRGGSRLRLTSATEGEPVDLALPVEDPAATQPRWGRYVAGVAAELGATVGLTATVTTMLPVGAGLSSSAALAVAVALALGAEGEPTELAGLAQRAEQRASGVPCGIMDQLASMAGVEGHGLLIDCHTLEVVPVPLPDDVEVVVVHSGQARALAGSAYGQRRAECEAAEAEVGPLRLASTAAVSAIADPVLRRRARHVVGENERVRAFAEALRAGDTDLIGDLMARSHASLRDDFEVSTPQVDSLVAQLGARPGVHGVRMTGGGFGGCLVVLCRPGALEALGDLRSWTVRASAGARLLRG